MSRALLEVDFTSATESDTIALTGLFNISIDYATGSGVGTVELQRSFDNGATWHTTDTFTTDTETNGEAASDLLWQLDCTAYTSGTIACILEQ